ncbi:MAG: hypothetical protein U9R24_07700, partial [Thermodesulfobacteriota bacterium]|nr:hypothetical protein [Thermodesulfobacteriota bacterium]
MENTNTTETNESVDTGVENNTTAETGNESGDTLYANKYKSVDELKKGINNLGTKLPDYILDGLSNGALEMHY